MSRKRKPLPLLENVTIEAVAAEGKCVAHVGEMVVFVPFVVPGDVVDLRVRKKRRSYCEATVERFIKKSDVRTEPMCPHFGICGGCKWQTLPYEKQLEAKQQQVYDQLTRIGHVQLPQITPILGSQQTRAYRNKLEFGCSDKRWYTAEDLARLPEGVGLGEPAIGFHITGAFDKIYPITDCQLMDPLQNELRNDIFDWAVAHDLSFFDTHKRTGLLRNLMVRNSNTGEWMLVIQFCIFPEGGAGDHYDPVAAAADDKLFETEDGRKALALMEHITERFPQISSLLYVNNTKGNDTIGDLPLRNFHGTDFIYELMEDLRFKVGPKSFYQTNTEQAYHLYEVARRFACLTGEELVYDLYTGTGTIANFVAKGTEWDSWMGVPYIVKEFEGVKGGVIGMDTPNIPAWEVESHYEGIDFRNLVPTVEHFVPILREQEGCDVVIVVAHSGVEDAVSTDGNNPADYENQVRAMINLTTGIDAVVYGHFHNTDYREDILNAEGKVVPVLAGGGGEGLGFMKLAYDPATKTVTPVTAENGYRFLADQEGLVENQKVATALAPYNEELQAYLDQPLGTATGAFSNENISLQPTALMDLLNKAHWLYRVNMTGEQLRLWLEHATTNYTSASNPDYLGGGYYTDEIYGLYYEIHYYAPEGKRIQNMQYQGQPVAPDQVFSVVMNNYLFTGGAGFMQAAGLTPEDYSLTDMYTGDTLGNDNGQVRNILAQYIRDQKEITPTVESTWQFFRTKEDAIAAGAKVVE